MKLKHVLASILCCMIWFAAYSTETEPNDTKGQANKLNLNGSNSGAINPAGDVDWWKITTTSDGQLNVSWTAKGGHYTYCQLYDNNGTTLLQSNYTNGSATISQDGLSPGTYFVKVFAFNAGDTSNYSISNTLTAAPLTNDVEPDGLYTQANTMTLNSSITGHVGYYYNLVRDTTDWFKFTTNGDGMVNLQMSSSNGQYIYWQLYDNNGTTAIDVSHYTNGTASYNVDGLAAGTYYVKVFCYYNNGFAPYTLTNTLTVPTEANDVEPNGTKSQAITLSLNSSKTGHVGYYYNLTRDTTDWYKITTNADGRIKLSLAISNGQYIYWQLYDNNGTTAIDNGHYTNGNANYSVEGLAAGTYFVKVFCFYTNGFAPYTLSDSLFVPSESNDPEPNGTTAQATTFNVNSTVTGHVNYYYNLKRDTTDWYKIVTTEDGMIGLTLTISNGRYVYFQLYDNDGVTALDAGHFTNGTLSYNVDGLAAGTYYVKVFCFYNYDFAPYTLSNTLSTYTNANDGLSNDFAKFAATLPSNGSTPGHVNFRNNGGSKDAVDWWKTNFTGSGNLTVTMNLEANLFNGAPTYTWMQVYKDTAQAPLFSNYTNGSSLTANLTGLSQGYFYVKVYTFYNYNWSAYNLVNSYTENCSVVTIKAKNKVSGTSCTNSSVKMQCSGNNGPYTVQLYRYGNVYGSPVAANSSGLATFTGLPPGTYTGRGYADGASCGTLSSAAKLVPLPTSLSVSSIAQTSAQLNWSNLSCVEQSKVQYRKVGVSTWTTKKIKNANQFYSVTGLSANTNYEWQVAGVDTSSGGSSTNSKYVAGPNFTTTLKLSADENAVQTNLSVYPNPASSSVQVAFDNGVDGTVTMRLFDVNGRIMFSQVSNEASGRINEQLNLTTLSEGVYQLQIITADGTVLNQSVVKGKE